MATFKRTIDAEMLKFLNEFVFLPNSKGEHKYNERAQVKI